MHALEASGPDRGRKIIVEDLISFFVYHIRTLFDYGVSHSFISSSLLDSLHLNTCIVSGPVVVSIFIGGTTHLSMICRGLRISIFDIKFE